MPHSDSTIRLPEVKHSSSASATHWSLIGAAIDAASAENRYTVEIAHHAAPDQVFDRQWALTTLDQALAAVRAEYAAAGKLDLHDRLRTLLWDDDHGKTYAELASDIGMTEAAVKMAVVRLRRRCRHACLEKEPRRRYATAGALAEDLGHFLRHEPIQARPVPTWEHGLKWIRRNPWRAALAAASAVAFLTAVGFALELAANQENRRVIGKLTQAELELSKVIQELNRALSLSQMAHREERVQRERAQAAELKSNASLQEVQVARNAAARSDYLRLIAEAHQALEANSVSEAERLLDGCAEPLRRWEWRYLKGLTQPEWEESQRLIWVTEAKS